MKKLIPIIALLLFLLSGCGTAAWYGYKLSDSMGIAKRNNSNMAKISLGMPKEKVVEIMGSPDKTEAYQLGKGIEYLFYRTQPCDSDLNDVDANFTPIAIEENKVIGWGRNFYEQQKQRYEIEIK